MLNRDKNLNLISLSILIIDLLDSVWTLKEEFMCLILLLGVNGLNISFKNVKALHRYLLMNSFRMR